VCGCCRGAAFAPVSLCAARCCRGPVFIIMWDGCSMPVPRLQRGAHRHFRNYSGVGDGSAPGRRACPRRGLHHGASLCTRWSFGAGVRFASAACGSLDACQCRGAVRVSAVACRNNAAAAVCRDRGPRAACCAASLLQLLARSLCACSALLASGVGGTTARGSVPRGTAAVAQCVHESLRPPSHSCCALARGCCRWRWCTAQRR
jgi:hypothetical protein